MDPVSARMVRAALIWLGAGVVLGGLMLADASIPGDWLRWSRATHVHMILVGWLLQFALGVGYWLLPRRRTPDRPLGYQEGLANAAMVGLNLGLLGRVVAEPLSNAGVTGGWLTGMVMFSAATQVLAIGCFIVQLWSRATPRPVRSGAPRGATLAAGAVPDQSADQAASSGQAK